MSPRRVEPAYPPLDVPKPVDEGIWIVDSGPLRVLGMPLPVRMTVLRLSDGGLWLHSPTRYDPDLHETLEIFGPIRHLVAPNSAHWTFVEAWQRHCPEARVWAAPGLRDRAQVRKSGLRIDFDLPETAPADWTRDLTQVVVPGLAGFREVAFHHRASRTLLLTDLVQNLEPDRLPAPMRPLARLARVTAPTGRAPAYLRLAVKLKGRAPAEAARRLVGFQPVRVIFSHGRWFERDGTARLARSLAWLLPR
ncbi:DUF4336 domain-containing protein [Methylobacterium durans]|uniref:DUF4336 domain-containing protein n=1 Tax=Methylobacterium durans TaxID=2202825 RepID=A0A2U8WFD4_9HYPH|nr:DUF4336 domain-containing protein [Methylobacterium durans]AWN43982.1 hypothetical protein DK389_30100 [Methylobacterium durans]